MLRQESFYLEAGAGVALATAWHPASADRDTGAGLLFCPPLLQEEQFARPVLVALARDLAEAGVSVLRFDYPGTGDSTGDAAELGEGDLLAAIALELAVLRAAVPGEIALLGGRWGAALARLAASRCPEVARLVLIDPVFEVGAFLGEVLRGKVTQQTVQCGAVTMNRAAMQEELAAGRALEVYGYPLSARLYEETLERGAVEPGAERICPTLVVRMTERGRGKPEDGGPRLGELLSDTRVDADGVEREVLLFDESIWKEPKAWRPARPELRDLVLEWVAPAPPGPLPRAGVPPSGGKRAVGSVARANGCTERLVAFEAEGSTLRGVLHTPAAGAAPGPAVLMLPAGVVGRSGPGGLYTVLARALATAGWPVLRVDLSGLGEADGALAASTRWAAFRQLEEGLHLPEILVAAAWLRRETGAGSVAPLGLCGSGVTAAMAAAQEPTAAGCLLLNPQFMLTDVDESGQRGGAVFGEAYVQALVPKLLRGRSLWRLITLRSDWRKIGRALADVARSRLAGGRKVHPFLNLRLVESLARCHARKRAILIVLGEWDDNRLKYEAEYVGKALRQRRYACAHERAEIARGDHNFTGVEARAALIETLTRWLRARGS